MGKSCAPLIAYLFCYAREFMLSLSGSNQAERVEAFKLYLKVPRGFA